MAVAISRGSMSNSDVPSKATAASMRRARFIPVAVMQHFECVTSPLAVGVDIGAKMRGMWR